MHLPSTTASTPADFSDTPPAFACLPIPATAPRAFLSSRTTKIACLLTATAAWPSLREELATDPDAFNMTLQWSQHPSSIMPLVPHKLKHHGRRLRQVILATKMQPRPPKLQMRKCPSLPTSIRPPYRIESTGSWH
ncbi:hypothetical protein CMUS01_01770 [Colletotrichum musicola]|uniref:Uncharacterized protein n=1 Tax=Colletotrichum musicola TaxID=2175873 RepID=A0A8H6NW82_9PEZI|nr:hypothetical protein CMUS01_01770 [Colletotrichum musicola]